MSSDWDIDTSELTPEQVSDLKAQHGPIIKTSIDGVSYYFRTLTRAQAASLGLTEGAIDPEMEDLVFETCLVHPEMVDFDQISAGAPTRICQEILERSGLAGAAWLNKYLDRSRERQTAYHTIAATICAAFPSVVPSELDDLNIDTLMELVVQAEEVLSIKARVMSGLYVPLSFEDDSMTSEATELSDEAKNEMMIAMLNGAMPDGPTGVIDRSKVPPGARHYMDEDDL